MTVSFLEVVAAAESDRVALPGELVGYLMVGAAEQLLDLPRAVTLTDLFVFEDGTVCVNGGVRAEPAVAEAALRESFRELLAHASPVTKALARVGNRRSGAGVSAFARELECALIPLNRAAGKRALARLHRDGVRATALLKNKPVPERVAPEQVAPPKEVAPACAMSPVSSPATVAERHVEPGSEAPRADLPFELLMASVPAPPVAATPLAPVPEPEAESLPREEEPTRPEPVIVRASQRPLAVSLPPADALGSHTPLLGTFLSEARASAAFGEPAASSDDLTERMPEACADTLGDPETFAPWESQSPPPSRVSEEPRAGDEPETPEPVTAEPVTVQPLELGAVLDDSPVACIPEAVDSEVLPADEPEPLFTFTSLCADEAWDDDLDAAWDRIALDVVRGSDVPEPPSFELVPLDPMTLTIPGLGIAVAERPLMPTPQKELPTDPAPLVVAPPRFVSRRSDVEALLRGFAVGDAHSEFELCRELSELAGVG